MANITKSLSHDDINFITKQKMFFVSTAPKTGKINLSPKGLDESFKIIDKNKILWLNYFGTRNETAKNLLQDDRMTIMFCSFESEPNVLRLFCKAKSIERGDESWESYISNFTRQTARQIFELTIEEVSNSSGMGVPIYNFINQREDLENYYDSQNIEEEFDYMKNNGKSGFN